MRQKATEKTSETVFDDGEHFQNGLWVRGTVQGRVRKYITDRSGKRVEVVTYTIQADSRRYYVEEYEPSDYYDVDSFAEMPVYIKPYIKKAGGASYTLGVLKDHYESNRGEAF